MDGHYTVGYWDPTTEQMGVAHVPFGRLSSYKKAMTQAGLEIVTIPKGSPVPDWMREET